MKIASLLGFALVLVGTAANADSFHCQENSAEVAAKKRAPYTVRITEGRRLPTPKNYDYAAEVRVEMFYGRNLQKDFVAVAKSEDVIYEIRAWKDQDFNMGIYLDELDQTWVNLRGRRETINLTCRRL